MECSSPISQRLLEFIIRLPGSEIEDILFSCPDLTWNQVFFELDRLSRSGSIVLMQKGPGHYSAAPAKEITANASTH